MGLHVCFSLVVVVLRFVFWWKSVLAGVTGDVED